MQSNKKKFKECIMFNLEQRHQQNNKLLDDFFALDWRIENEFQEYLNEEMKLYLNKNDITYAKYQFLANKIYNKEEKFINYFENILKNDWIKMGYDVSLLENVDGKNSKEKLYQIITSKKTKQEIDIYMPIMEYFITLYSKSIIFSQENEKLEIINYINKKLKIEDILNEKMFDKYCKRRIKEFCEYIKVEEMELKNLLYYLFTNPNIDFYKDFDIKNNLSLLKDFNEKNKTLFNFEPIKQSKMINDDFNDLNLQSLYKGVSSFSYLINLYGDNYFLIDKNEFNLIFDEALSNTLLIHLKNCIMFDKNHPDFSLSMIIRMTEIDNFDYFSNILCSQIFEIFLLKYIKEMLLQEKEQNISKIDTSNSYEEELNSKDNEILKLKAELEKMNTKYEIKEKELLDLKKEIDKNKKNLESKYISEIRNLNKQIEQSNDLVKSLQDDVLELNEIRKTLLTIEDDKENEPFDLTKVDLSTFKDKRYIFIGGRFELLKKLEPIFPKGKFYHTKPQNGIDINKTDKIIIFPKNINHPMYWDAINLAKGNNIPFIFTLGTNLDTVMRDIIENE